MSTTVIVDLDSETLALAEQEALTHNTTVSALVGQQLTVMARNWRDSQAGKTPLTDALRGAVKLPADFHAPSFLTEELGKKHGGQT